MAEPRTWFIPVVGAGVVSAALASTAGAKAWFDATAQTDSTEGFTPATSIDQPLALAVALVVLAAWGAALVTRGRVRRLILVLAALFAAGFIACVVMAPLNLPDDLREQMGAGGSPLPVSATGWYFVAVVAGLGALASTVVGVRLAPRWPAMGTRYDAPGAQVAPRAPETDQELWKALSEGRDPTGDPNP